jgi:hypothetical protein
MKTTYAKVFIIVIMFVAIIFAAGVITSNKLNGVTTQVMMSNITGKKTKKEEPKITNVISLRNGNSVIMFDNGTYQTVDDNDICKVLNSNSDSRWAMSENKLDFIEIDVDGNMHQWRLVQGIFVEFK